MCGLWNRGVVDRWDWVEGGLCVGEGVGVGAGMGGGSDRVEGASGSTVVMVQ